MPGSIEISGVYYDGCEIECAEDEVTMAGIVSIV